MEKMKLGEIVENTISGEWGTEEKRDENDIFVIRTADFCNDGRINYSNIIKRNIAKRKIEEKSLKIGDIIVEKSGGTDKNPVGRVVLFDKENCKCLANNFTQVLRIKKEHYYKFIFYQLFYKYKSGGTLQMFNKTTGIQNLQMKLYINQELNVCDKKEQIKISNLLDKVQEIVDTRKKQIEELDELIKSQFVEMFENKNFEKKSLNEISVIKGEYGLGASAGEFVEGQPRYVRITDIQENGRLDNQSLASPKNEKNIDKYILKYGDVLFARTGATVGKTYKYNENDGYCVYAGYCIRFRLDLKICNPDYIFIYTKTDNYKKWVENKQRVVAQPNINAKEYGNDLKIPIPPIELQNKFAEFVKQIDKQKFEIQKSLEETQKLQESLMNKYFG